MASKQTSFVNNTEVGDSLDIGSTGNNTTNGSSCLDYHYYGQTSVYVMGVVGLPVIIFGLLSNVLSVMIFLNRAMRHSSVNWYLTGRSATDFLLLVATFFTLNLPRLGELYDNFLAVNISYFATPVTYGLALMAQTASIYLTVLMTAHRFIGVCFPFRAVDILSGQRVKMALTSVLVFSVLFNITRFIEVEVSGYCVAPNINHSIYMLTPTEIRLDSTYQTIFFGWCYTIIMFLIPFAGLIVMNAKVIHAVHRTRKLHEDLHSSDDAMKRLESKKEISTSIMLVGVVVVFLACNTLTVVLNVVEVAGLNTKGETYSFLVDISNLLVAVSCSINIFVYCLFSEKYRILLKYYLCCNCFREGEMLLTTINN